jgi:hypothetical protein
MLPKLFVIPNYSLLIVQNLASYQASNNAVTSKQTVDIANLTAVINSVNAVRSFNVILL